MILLVNLTVSKRQEKYRMLVIMYRIYATDDFAYLTQSKKISNDQELIKSDPTSCPQNQKGNN